MKTAIYAAITLMMFAGLGLGYNFSDNPVEVVEVESTPPLDPRDAEPFCWHGFQNTSGSSIGCLVEPGDGTHVRVSYTLMTEGANLTLLNQTYTGFGQTPWIPIGEVIVITATGGDDHPDDLRADSVVIYVIPHQEDEIMTQERIEPPHEIDYMYGVTYQISLPETDGQKTCRTCGDTYRGIGNESTRLNKAYCSKVCNTASNSKLVGRTYMRQFMNVCDVLESCFNQWLSSKAIQSHMYDRVKGSTPNANNISTTIKTFANSSAIETASRRGRNEYRMVSGNCAKDWLVPKHYDKIISTGEGNSDRS